MMMGTHWLAIQTERLIGTVIPLGPCEDPSLLRGTCGGFDRLLGFARGSTWRFESES